jgi:acetyl-CoA acyltransferase
MSEKSAYLCDAIRTPVGRYGGGLSSVRPDDLLALTLSELLKRNPGLKADEIDDVLMGCANQAGEDNRNVARMSLLLAGLPETISGATINRLCGSGMDAVGSAARAIKAGEAKLILAGGVESMSRAPLVMSKATTGFSRAQEMFDSSIGWRFVNPEMEKVYGVDGLGITAENLAEEYKISREDQDAYAYQSQQRAKKALDAGFFKNEIMTVEVAGKKNTVTEVSADEHPRPDVTLESLAKLKAVFKKDGTVTAGSASGMNDGACSLIVASEAALSQHDLTPRVRVLAMATTGVSPRVMGIGPVTAVNKVLAQTKLTLKDMHVIECNEAFAAQVLSVTRTLGLSDDCEILNPNGGAIALGHPLGMSGARLLTTAMYQLESIQGKYALCSMCVGVGQGIAVVLERA